MTAKTSFIQRVSLVIGGVFLCLVILELGLRLGGFILSSVQEYRNKVSLGHKGTYRIMCLGESTTAEQYPPILEKILNQSNIGISFSVIDKGLTSMTTHSILSSLEANLDTYRPDMVITMMGVNDSGEVLPYETDSGQETVRFPKTLRVYKLYRLLGAHITNKSRQLAGYLGQKKDNPEADDKGLLLEIERLEKEARLGPHNIEAHLELGRHYVDFGAFSKAEEIFKKTTRLNPKDDRPYYELARLYQEHASTLDAERTYEQAVALNSKNAGSYVGLGFVYYHNNKFSKAEKAFKRAIELNPIRLSRGEDSPYLGLAWLYVRQGKVEQAQRLLRECIDAAPDSDGLFTALANLFGEAGDVKLMQEYYEKARGLWLSGCRPETVSNYRKLRRILTRRNIRFVCAQYPMCNVQQLKDIFRLEEGIVFVDNEGVFKEALQKGKYSDYFVDMFGQCFGHCTDKGNRLLAENIADTIIKEVFKK